LLDIFEGYSDKRIFFYEDQMEFPDISGPYLFYKKEKWIGHCPGENLKILPNQKSLN